MPESFWHYLLIVEHHCYPLEGRQDCSAVGGMTGTPESVKFFAFRNVFVDFDQWGDGVAAEITGAQATSLAGWTPEMSPWEGVELL